VGSVVDNGCLQIKGWLELEARRGRSGAPLAVSADLTMLKEAWQSPLRW
jgi:hypothetical protein